MHRYSITLIVDGMPIGREPFVEHFRDERQATDGIAALLASQGLALVSVEFRGLDATVHATVRPEVSR